MDEESLKFFKHVREQHHVLLTPVIQRDIQQDCQALNVTLFSVWEVKVISSSRPDHKLQSLRPNDEGRVYTEAKWAPDNRPEAAGLHQNISGLQ